MPSLFLDAIFVLATLDALGRRRRRGGGGLLQQEKRFGEKVSGWMNHNVTGGAVLSIHGVYDFVNPKIFQGG